MMIRLALSSIILAPMLLSIVAWDSRNNFNELRNHTIVRRDTNINYTNIMNFWEKHKNKIVFNGELEDVVLVMGNTGSGKTTLISALIGRKLRVIKPNGYFVIVDEEDRIGTGSSSKTLVPEAMIDSERNITYIDCPGFRDNRNVEYEISSMYFQNILMNQVEKTKMILVINYDSLKYNGNKNDFDDLFEHLGEFMTDISKFRDGIALVATKVENVYEDSDDGMVLTNNNQLVLEGIADYLESKKEMYRSKLKDLEKYKMFVNVIDALLQKTNNSYTRIAIFRQPAGPGLLKNLTRTTDELNAIAGIVKNLNYVDTKRNDFAFALSKSSKHTVDEIVDNIFRNAFTSRLHEMGNETIMHYLQLQNLCSDTQVLHEQVSHAYDVISGIPKVDEPLALFKEFVNAANTLNISLSLTSLNIVSDDIKALRFFTTVTNSNEDTHMLLLKHETQNLIESVGNLKSFYDFLDKLQEDLAAYKSQNLKNDSRIANIMKSCANSRYKVVQDIMDLENIVKEIGSDRMYRNIKTLELNEYQLTLLKAVFDAFSSNLKITCPSSSSGQLTVKGYNVKMSDVVNVDCWPQAKNIQVLALNKVFIDCTINKTGEETQLFIYAPTWEVVYWQKIILNGKAGEPHQNAFAKSSNITSENGRNGAPGLPGGPAGHFFGVGEKFINSEQLEIHANGGQGGPGQHGGNGSDGISGDELSDDFFKISDFESPYDLEVYFKAHNLLRYTLNHISSHESTLDVYVTSYENKYEAYVYGNSAQKPTNGGDGGAGGRGGYPGRIEINGLGTSVNIKIVNNPGFLGLDGQGGHGGKESSHGRSVYFDYIDSYTKSGSVKSSHRSSYKNIGRAYYYGILAPAGNDGKPGKNKDEEKFPTNSSMRSPSVATNSFKEFLRQNLYKNVKEQELKALIFKLETNNQIKAQYDTLAIVKELEGLENQFLELRNQIDFVPFYDSLLSRIEELALSQTILENKKVLSYVYTAALTKVFALKKKRKGKTVVNLYQYLNTIETSVREIRDAQHLQIVQNYRNDYKNTLLNKIREANYFIKNKIEAEINKLWEESDIQIMAIIEEIKQKKNITKGAITLSMEQRKKIKNMMHLRMTLLPLKLVASGLTFLGPVGAIAGATITSSVTIAEGMTLDRTSGLGINRIHSLDPTLKVMSRVTDIFNNKPQKLAEQLSEVTKKLDNYKEELFVTQKEKIEISQRIGELKAQAEEVEKRKVNRITDSERREKDANRIKTEINEFINSRKDIMEKEQKHLKGLEPDKKKAEDLKKEKKLETNLRRLNHVQEVLNSVEIVFNVFKRLENDEGAIRNIDKLMSEYNDELKSLEKLEGQVYNVVIPDLREIENTINAIKNSVNGSSHAKLDLTKWTVRSTLRDVKSLLQKFTQRMSFELQSNLQRFMEKIDEGFSILIDIYDRIDSYSDSVKQAEYIAHIVSAPMSNIKVTDSELSDAVTALKLIIHSNILFEKYGIALHAFKQHYFPFAAHVLQKFHLPTSMRPNDTETLRSNIIERIKDMKNEIDERRATIDEYTKFTHKNNVFNSNTTGSSPFYLWRHDTIKDEVQQLLNGSEIILKADITKGLYYNSVKYTDIGINFKLQDEKLQEDFTAILKNFALTMTMVGNNYYRCGERYYFISFDDDITMSYTLSKDKAENWINPNLVYTTIRGSHPFLSPYGMWSIKLNSVNNSISFDNLKLFANQTIDLELIGHGYYIKQDSDFNLNICNEYLSEFYDVENIVAEL